MDSNTLYARPAAGLHRIVSPTKPSIAALAMAVKGGFAFHVRHEDGDDGGSPLLALHVGTAGWEQADQDRGNDEEGSGGNAEHRPETQGIGQEPA